MHYNKIIIIMNKSNKTKREKELEKQGIKPTRWGDPGFVEAMQNIQKAREALKDCK